MTEYNMKDSKIEYLFYTCSVATGLVTSQSFQLLSYGAVLYWIRRDSVLTPNSSTNLITLTEATSGYRNYTETTCSRSLEWGVNEQC